MRICNPNPRAAFGFASFLALTMGGQLAAQTWTGAVSGIWNNGSNWNPVGVPASSISTRLIFDATPFATMTNNIAGTLSLNRMTFNAGSPTYAVSGNPFDFEFGSFSFPAIVVNSNNNVTIGDALTLGGTFTVSGAGAGITALNGAISGGGSLTYSGAGTLTLGATNSYSGGTTVSSGTLMLGAGTAIPANTPVTVAAGAQFNIGSLSNTGSAIGTLTLNGGTFRVPSGSGDYFLNQLNMTGGTVDFSGAGNFWLHFVNSGAGITTNASSSTATWIGSSSSRIQNETASPLTITVNAGSTPSLVDLDAGIILSAGGTNPNFIKAGAGNLRLSNVQNTANITVSSGYVFSNDLATNLGSGAFGTLGTGIITLSNGGLYYDGPTATSTKPLSITNLGSIQIAGNANLTLAGAITQTMPSVLRVFGNGIAANPSILTLTGLNTYQLGTTVSNAAVVAVSAIGDEAVNGPLGQGDVILGSVNNGRGDILYTGTNASTNRNATVFGSYFLNSGGGIGVQNVNTNLVWNGAIGGTGSLIKTGAGTLTLTNTTNNYTSGTFIEAGTLNVGALGAVLPANRDITVFNGATLNIGFSDNDNSSGPVGTIALNGSQLRISGSNTAYYLGALQIGSSGGTVDFTGSSGALYLTGTAPAIVINGDSQFTSPGAPPVIFSPTAPRITLTVAPNKTLTSSVAIGQCQILGGGTVYMRSQPNDYAASFVVTQGRLRLDDMTVIAFKTVLGQADPGLVTLDGGILQYSGPTAASPMPLSTSQFGGTLEISNSATTLTYTGDFSGLGPLTKGGPGVLVLNNLTNSYASGLIVSGGRLDVSDDAQLGLANPTVNPAGTLRYTSSTSTSRTITLNSGALEVANGATLTLNGASVGGGFLRGSGIFRLTGNAAVSGSTSLNSTTINQIGPASLTNFTNGGALTNNLGTTLTWNGGINQASGNLTINGTANVSDLTHYGTLNIPSGGLMTNTGSTNLVFGGGSTSFVGSVANPGGKIDLGGQQLIVRGGLLVTNAGSFGSGNGVRNGTTVADYGALVKGTGPYQSVITQNGGQYLPGNSPGTSQVGDFTINGGGNLIFEITDAGPSASFPSAPGTAGANPGWGLTQIFNNLFFTATPSNRFNIDMRTQLAPPAAPNSPGQMSSFDPNRAYSWLIFDLQPGAVFNGTFNPAAINFITTQFANPTVGGTFSLSRTGGQIFLTFTPVPEPTMILGAALIGWAGWMLRRRFPRNDEGRESATSAAAA